MLGARLARPIVFPLLALLGVLFVVLGVVSVRVAEARVAEELETTADRVAAALARLPQHPPEILDALGRLVGAELVVGGVATRPEWEVESLAGAEAGRVVVDGEAYRALVRTFPRPPGRCLVLFDEDRLGRRRRDVLVPIAVAGALGLLVALVLGLAVARAIARPVRRLADSVKGFAAGRDVADVGARGPGEIGELQDAFVRMVGEIREQEARLRESERFAALGRLAGGIAHELRNPLTAIRMAVEGMDRGDAEARGEARRVALAEIDRLDRTLRELLDFVRPRRPALRDVAVRPLLEEVAALLGPQCRHLRVALEVDAPAGLVVRADPDRLKQALLNLVLNGAQAQPGGGSVWLRARPGVLEVRDAGGGIPASVRETLTQPFVTTKAAGIGLGLAVVAQVAEEHGARLVFDSGPEGTTAALRFPGPGA